MEVLWAAFGTELTGREVADALPRYAYTTVATVLNRMSRKGLVRRRMEGRTTHFAAIDTQADLAAAAMREALDASDDREAALARFAQTVTPAEAATLRHVLDGKD